MGSGVLRLGAYLFDNLFQHVQRLRADDEIFFGKDQRGDAVHAIFLRRVFVHQNVAQIILIRQNLEHIRVQTNLREQRLLHLRVAHIQALHPVRVQRGIVKFIAFAARVREFFQLMQRARIDAEGALMNFDAVIAFHARGENGAVRFNARAIFRRKRRRAVRTQFERAPMQFHRMCFVEALETQAAYKTPRSDKIRPNVNANCFQSPVSSLRLSVSSNWESVPDSQHHPVVRRVAHEQTGVGFVQREPRLQYAIRHTRQFIRVWQNHDKVLQACRIGRGG